MISVNNGFYNPGGVFVHFNELLKEMKLIMKKLDSSFKIKPRIKDKYNYEGVLTFEYLEREEDLLAPALYKDIITNEKITEENCKLFHNFILSFDEKELNRLIKNLVLFKYVPFEILSKFWARCYTVESDFYKNLNNKLMKSELSFNNKTFINMLYTGVEINSLKSFSGNNLFRGSSINKIEIDKIKKYKNLGKLSSIVVFSKAFLSFSEDEQKAKIFCGESDNTKVGCLFILENNNINLHESNADIHNYSTYPSEKEILFFPGSSFIIKNIEDFDKNKIKIILNYHGKFKEEYSLYYQDEEKLNNLISTNELTKNIAGEKLCFLKNGKYLKGEIIKKGGFCNIFKGKDLETDEIVCIKQYKKVSMGINQLEKEVNILKQISEKIKYSCKFKDNFETEKYIYIIISYYDGSLARYFKNNKKNLSPNLIKKIFKQLNLVFKELLSNRIAHRNIMPSNILIKYSNQEKTTFDSILSDYGISKEYSEDNLLYGWIGDVNYMAPEIFKEKAYKNNCDLFSIGVTIYYLHFGKLPFVRIYANNEINMNIKIEEDRQLEDLLIKLLKENSDERITWEEYFEHPFFKQYEY